MRTDFFPPSRWLVAWLLLFLVNWISQVQASPVAELAQPVWARHGMVSSQEQMATRVGLDILRRGGNAVDAAVAVGFTLAVTLPRAGNLGGGGFMLVHLAKEQQTIAILGRGRNGVPSWTRGRSGSRPQTFQT